MISVVFFLSIVLLRKQFNFSFKRVKFIGLAVFSSWMFLLSVNFIVDKTFFLSKSSHVFLTAHLNETGILKEILDDHCHKDNPYRMCALKDSLPTNLAAFIFNSNVLDHMGGMGCESKRIFSYYYAFFKHD